jgi:hypothetical protein
MMGLNSPPAMQVQPGAQGSSHERPPRYYELGRHGICRRGPRRPAANPAFGATGPCPGPASRCRSARSPWQRRAAQSRLSFFTHEDIAPDDMLQSHIEATYSRLNAVPEAFGNSYRGHWHHLLVAQKCSFEQRIDKIYRLLRVQIIPKINGIRNTECSLEQLTQNSSLLKVILFCLTLLHLLENVFGTLY